ncbi:hypothetical protein [Engelhardtia mirabilis]|uniref:Uncharacterized protein n=1 Tax=Engelhardtia mirabilis TaxID=2528011 RepID=A0A518BFA1_9BACT|nr:hypothetical protein Pla133_07230 [Planctomycetes bacterium Pla133]QDU99983.1 hypothetical protein Pla86_07220 [Planctomycetes bacterium Pla86]
MRRPDGSSAAGAEVRLAGVSAWSAIADGGGRVQFAAATVDAARRHSDPPLVVATLRGFGERGRYLAEGVARIELTLDDPWSACIAVVSASGAPVDEVDLRWHSATSQGPWVGVERSRLGPGQFLLENLEAERGILMVEAPGRQAAVVELVAARVADSRALPVDRIVLGSGGPVTVEVVDDLGQPLAGAQLTQTIHTPSEAAGALSAHLEYITDEAGRAQVEAVPASNGSGGSLIAVRCEGHREAIVIVDRSQFDAGRIVVELERAARLRVRVVDAEGRGVSGFAVLSEFNDHDSRARRAGVIFGDLVGVDDGGYGVFERAPARQRLELRVLSSGHVGLDEPDLWSREIRRLEPGREREEIVVLEDRLRVDVDLRGGDGRPIAGVVTLTPAWAVDRRQASRERQSVRVEAGRSACLCVRTGSYVVRIAPHNWIDGVEQAVEIESDTRSLELVVESLEEVAGRLVDALGQPLAGERIGLSVKHRLPVFAATDEIGRFRFRGVLTAPSALVFEGPGGAQLSTALDGAIGELGDVVWPR